MSERVLHEWTTESGRRLSILDESDAFGKGEVGIGVDGEIDSSLGWGLALARELARLAARVAELEAENERLRDEVDRQTKAKECYEERQARKEAENARLRKCVEAADRIDGFAVAGSVLLEQRGHKRDADEAMEYVKAYRAARAEVDNG